MNERIKEVRKALGLTQQEFADRLHIKRSTISNYDLGRNTPVNSVIELIVREFGVNELWLRTGEGEMFKKATRNEELSKFFYDVLKADDESFQKRFVAALANCTPEMWELAAKFIDDLSK